VAQLALFNHHLTRPTVAPARASTLGRWQ
jgi:hypothetical protein